MDAVLPRLHHLVADNATGVVWIRGGPPYVRLELVSGWIHAFVAVDPPADEDQLATAARRKPPHNAGLAFTTLIRDAAFRNGDALERSDEPRMRIGATPPFHPTRLLRAIAATALAELADFAEADAIFSGVTLSLPGPLHASAVDPDEARAAALLAQRAHSVDELVARAGTVETRTRALLRELVVLGALRAGDRVLAIDLPGVISRARAAAAERKRAYHAEARKVHPDLHPDAAEEAKRKLNEEMAELAKKHRR